MYSHDNSLDADAGGHRAPRLRITIGDPRRHVRRAANPDGRHYLQIQNRKTGELEQEKEVARRLIPSRGRRTWKRQPGPDKSRPWTRPGESTQSLRRFCHAAMPARSVVERT